MSSPKNKFITIYGRKPVLEALNDRNLEIDKVLLAEQARGEAIDDIMRVARQRHITVTRTTAQRVKLLAGNGRHDQGVLVDVVAQKMRSLTEALDDKPPAYVVVLDGVTTPANVGMIIRAATAAGIGGIVVPHRGTASLDPLVVKASAGVAFQAPILRCDSALRAAQELRAAGYALVGLDSAAEQSLYSYQPPALAAFVMGNETTGISPAVKQHITDWIRIPMAAGVESLNVATAAAVLSFDLMRRNLS